MLYQNQRIALQEKHTKIEIMQQDLVDYTTNNDGIIIRQLEFINSVYANVPVELITELENRDDILTMAYYDKDAKSSLAVDESRNLVGIENYWIDDTSGEGVIVAVIDSGIDINHNDFGGINGIPKLIPEHLIDFVTNDFDGDDPQDCVGHGTTVSGILTGTGDGNPLYTGFAPKSRIMSLKAIENEGPPNGCRFLPDDAVIAALNHAMNSVPPPEVINLSLGSCRAFGGEDAIALAVDEAFDRGIAVVVASGNHNVFDAIPCTQTTSPGSAHKALTVGALNQDGTSAHFFPTCTTPFFADCFSLGGITTDGRVKPDLVAADEITTTLLGAQYEPIDDRARGTSFAAPQVAASIAVLEQLFQEQQGINLEPGRSYAILLSSASGQAFSSNGLRMDTTIGAGPLDLHRNITTESGKFSFTGTGQISFQINVPIGAERLSAAIWYPDDFGIEDTDIDLFMTSSTQPSAASFSFDSVVERIFLSNPVGTYTVTIDVFSIDPAVSLQDVYFAYSYELPNIAPTINSVSTVTTNTDTPTTITLTGSDLDSNQLRFFIVDFPDSGTLSHQDHTIPTPIQTLASSQVTYTPNSGFNGNDSFQVKVTDGFEESGIITVPIIVSSPSVLSFNAVRDAIDRIVITFSEIYNFSPSLTVNDWTLSQGTVTGIQSFSNSQVMFLEISGIPDPAVSPTVTYTPVSQNLCNGCPELEPGTSDPAESTIPPVVPPTTNTKPNAKAGPNQEVTEGDTVTLDGSGSSDPDNDPISFSWQQMLYFVH